MRDRRLLALAGTLAILASVSIFGADPAATSMATAATRFVSTLTPEQRQQAQFAFGGSERERWHFVPTEMFPRKGLTLKEMTPSQRDAAHALLRTGLSQHGYATATTIISLENILRAMEANGQFVRDPERYFFSVFGTPATDGTWGWRVEGHHVSLQFTIVNGAVTVSAPTFFGSNPAEVRDGDRKGLRVLGFEEDPARALLNALTPAQRGKAVISLDAPTDIVTMNRTSVDPLAGGGVPASDLDAAQRTMLMSVIEAYTGLMVPEVGALRLAGVRRAGIETVSFAWAGAAERGRKHYYRIQGPTFLIEYDNTQNDGNHVHSVWRDFAGDFGRDLLREHLRNGH
ncbi:MAG: DUF3500 domain-containing protein [Vicinamibacterales bacterium]